MQILYRPEQSALSGKRPHEPEDATVQLTPAKAVTARASTINAEHPSDEVTVQGGFFSNILTGEVVPLRLHL